MVRSSFFRRRTALVALLLLPVLLAGTRSRAVPVTLVAIPWGTASLDSGEPFIVPSTRMLEPGEYRLVVERSGYGRVERVIRVTEDGPQHFLIRLERR